MLCGKIQEFHDDWLGNGNSLIVEWVIKSWQAISNETVVKSMKSCGLALAVAGTEDDLILCLKERKKCA